MASAVQNAVVAFKATGAQKTSKQVDQIAGSLGRVYHAGTKANKMFRGMRGGAAQLGYQIQDVAVQLQSGQNALLVFGQQGSQVASIMGPGGALIGAVIAVGAALASVFTKEVKEAEKGLDDYMTALQETVNELGEFSRAQQVATLSKMIDQTFNYEQKLIDLKEAQVELAEEQKMAAHRSKLLSAAIRTGNDPLAAAIQLVNKFMGDQNDANQAVYDGEAAIELYEKRLKDLRATIEKLLSGQAILPDEIDETADAARKAAQETQSFLDSLMHQAATIGKSQTEVLRYQLDNLELTTTQRGEALALISVIEQHVAAEKRLTEAQKARKDLEKKAGAVVESVSEVGMSEIEKIKSQEEEKLEILREAQMKGIELEMSYAEARKRINEEAAAAIAASVMMQSQASLTAMGALVGQFQGLVDESSAAGKALFVASKAIAMATTFIEYEQAIAKAHGTDPIFGISMAAYLRAMQVASIASIAGQTVAGFEGGGITFSGVRSGGMDGKGGKLAMVHPNEKITDLEKMGHQSAQPVNVNFNITANDTKGFDQLLGARRELITQIVNSAINNRGRSSLA